MVEEKYIGIDCFKELFGFSDKAIENIRLNSKFGKSTIEMYRDVDSKRMVRHIVKFDFSLDIVCVLNINDE